MDALQSPIISCAELAILLNTPSLIILDASIKPVAGFNASEHQWPNYVISGARRFDIDDTFSDQSASLPHTMPKPEQFASSLRELGIENDSMVVVYDSYGLFSAARAWWMLKSMGIDNVRVLDGGLPAWIKFGGTVESASKIEVRRSDFKANFKAEYFTDKHHLLEKLSVDEVAILDARSPDRFFGRVPEPREGLRSGHMPNAHNVPFSSLLDDTGLLKSREALTNILQPKLDKTSEVITTCGSGITACVISLALAVIGVKSKVYDGSWSEWGADEVLPIE